MKGLIMSKEHIISSLGLIWFKDQSAVKKIKQSVTTGHNVLIALWLDLCQNDICWRLKPDSRETVPSVAGAYC